MIIQTSSLCRSGRPVLLMSVIPAATAWIGASSTHSLSAKQRPGCAVWLGRSRVSDRMGVLIYPVTVTLFRQYYIQAIQQIVVSSHSQDAQAQYKHCPVFQPMAMMLYPVFV